MNEQYNPYSGGRPANCNRRWVRMYCDVFLRTYAGVGESLGDVDYRDGQTCDDITVKPSEFFRGNGQNRSGTEIGYAEHEPYLGNQAAMGRRV